MNLDELKQKNSQTPSSSRMGGPPRRDPPFARPPEGLPAGYLANGYFDEKGNILPAVVIDWPKEIAQKLDNSHPGMNTAQLRKFFGEVRRIEVQINWGKSFDSLKGRIIKLDNYAAEAQQKGKVPLLFRQFIECNLKWAVKDQKSYLDGFVQHFEGVVAYFPKRQ
jgi:CRISPR/Cas system CSM-associated protein Csm2 small subunit